MNQLDMRSNPKDIRKDQFQYMGRWVDKETFRVFVYDKNGSNKLANSFSEYEKLIASGIWFDTTELAKEKEKSKERKSKNGILHADG